MCDTVGPAMDRPGAARVEEDHLLGTVRRLHPPPEDVYLTRQRAAARELVRVPVRSAAVRHRLAILGDTHAALRDDEATARGQPLKVAIVLLVIVELVVALLR